MILPTFQKLKKNLKKKDNAPKKQLKLAILGDSATQLVGTAIRGYGLEKGFDIEIYESDYDRIEPEIIDPTSGLYTFQPDIILLFHSTEKLQINFLKQKAERKSSFAIEHLASIEQYLAILNERLTAKVILSNYPVQPDEVFGNFALKTASSFRYQLAKINYNLLELSQDKGNVFLLDLEALQSYVGYQNRIDQRFYTQASLVLSLDFLPVFAARIMDIIGAITGAALRKCLILDLDNTTWGGIIGDDGVDKILVGNIKGGKPFTQLQKWAKELKKRGIILCICSKNTESVAKVPFEKHPEMVLRLEDISVFVANWENKADNIRHIQSVLNIGFDSMVFVDDNPMERDLVRSELPSVTVPELPKDPASYMAYLRGLNLFETATVSAEDASRTKKYQEEAKRVSSKMQFKSIDTYLESLEMVADIQSFNPFSIPRIAQLTQRSNQFNLRTVRYTEDQVKAIIESSSHTSLQIRLLDKFGDYGIISLIIGEIQDNERLFIDSWIMSCRVLKRGVEQLVLDQIVALAKEKQLKMVVGEYLPTPKNKLVEEHYKNLGFQQNGQLWELEVTSYTPNSKHIAILENEINS